MLKYTCYIQLISFVEQTIKRAKSNDEIFTPPTLTQTETPPIIVLWVLDILDKIQIFSILTCTPLLPPQVWCAWNKRTKPFWTRASMTTALLKREMRGIGTLTWSPLLPTATWVKNSSLSSSINLSAIVKYTTTSGYVSTPFFVPVSQASLWTQGVV